jgi:lysophospholipase L1-like esterase
MHDEIAPGWVCVWDANDPYHSNGCISSMYRFKSLYVSAALLLLNILLGVLVLNLVLACLFWMRDASDASQNIPAKTLPSASSYFNTDGSPVDNGKRNSYQLAWFDFNAYGSANQSYVSEVLDDFYELSRRGMAFQPWVLFSEPPFQGKHVNVEVDDRGFPRRRTVNPSNADGLPVVTIMVLGGSTTFGYNVADEETWPSHLADILNERARQVSLKVYVSVLNYGRGYYYPSQETMLLIDLLRGGHRPNAVIFLDGVNWSHAEDVPEFYKQAEQQFQNLQFTDKPDHPQVLQQIADRIPMVRLAQAIGRRLSAPDHQSVAQRVAAERQTGVAHIINGLRQNRAMAAAICRVYSIDPLFVLQPNALYNYPAQLYRRPLPNEVSSWHKKVQEVYPVLASEPGVVDLSGLFGLWGKEKKAIIDDLHYSAPFHRFLAEHIADHVDLKALKPWAAALDEAAATGLPRHSVDVTE